MRLVFLIFGVPCSGKSWVCEQLDPSKWDYISHDLYSSHQKLRTKAHFSEKHLIAIDCPFKERELRNLLQKDFKVIPVCVLASEETIERRYFKRNGIPAPQNILTRCSSIYNKILEWECYSGTSDEVLQYLKSKEQIK